MSRLKSLTAAQWDAMYAARAAWLARGMSTHRANRAAVQAAMTDQLGNQLRGQLHDQLADQLRGQLADQLGDQLRGQLGGQLDGQLAGAWSHVDALRTAAHAVLIATGHADELLPDGNEETDTPDALPEDLRDYHPDPAAALARCDPNLSFAVTGRTSVDAHADVAMALLTPDDPTLP